ncbi:MAG TPA: hypothetical protein DDZ80_28230 [Cyanobacteria bacterium UBA8803]|nr:hypothetical protein [Cyanobacteria bacterium UBA9273]HBL62149.1 hypothetical protein [Cyanobacteria bacterium UBA8803]
MLQIKGLNPRQRYLIKAIFWLTAILLGSIQAWSHRYTLSSGDCISYLDIGEAYLRGEWSQAINGYFNPLYSWLLAFLLSILKPSIYWEFFAVKIVNFFIYLLSLICFEFLMNEIIFSYNQKLSKASEGQYLIIPEWIWLVSGYTLFLWAALKWIGVNNDTPDMCVATLVYAAAAIVLRVQNRSADWWQFVLLGTFLGLGYLSKAIMFPMAFIFLGTCFFSVGNIRRALPRILVAILVFSLISAPFLLALSSTKGYLTFGRVGKLNYAWLVNEIPSRHWQGDPPGSGTPKHPTRKVFDNPAIYEFATPLTGTYPAGTDPSYWYEGVTPKFDLTKQLGKIWYHAQKYYRIFFGFFLFGYLTLAYLDGRGWLLIKDLIRNWRLIIPACAGLGALMLVHVRPRLIAAFIVLLFAGSFSSIRLPNSQESKRLIIGMTLGLLLLIGGEFTDIWQNPGEPIHWKIAQGLQQLGVEAGEPVAILGSYHDGSRYYWARLARVKIVAEIDDVKSFWEADDLTRAKIYETIAQTGAKVIVQKLGEKLPISLSASDWQEINDTDCYAYFV